MRELKATMNFYMVMKDYETQEEAIDRFWEEFATEKMTTESSMQVHYFEVQEL